MNPVNPGPDAGNRAPHASLDEVDRLLSAFFRAEMPSRWPDPPGLVPSAPAVPRHTRWFSTSKMVLAASVALLLVGHWLLPKSALTDAPPGSRLEIGKRYRIKESLLQEFYERPGPDGKPVRKDLPTKVIIEFFEKF